MSLTNTPDPEERAGRMSTRARCEDVEGIPDDLYHEGRAVTAGRRSGDRPEHPGHAADDGVDVSEGVPDRTRDGAAASQVPGGPDEVGQRRDAHARAVHPQQLALSTRPAGTTHDDDLVEYVEVGVPERTGEGVGRPHAAV